MNKKLTKIIITCLVVTVGVGGYFAYKSYVASKTKSTQNSFITAVASKNDITVNIQATGTISPAATKEILSNNGGEIKELSVKEGDMVKKGQKLFGVDSDDLRQQVDKAEYSLQQENLKLEKTKTEEEKEIQELAVEQAGKDLQNKKNNLYAMTVTSPIDGMISVRNNNNGDNVQSGKSILSIVDVSSFKINVQVDELDIAKVKQGQKAEIKIDAIKDKTFEGTVEEISPVGTTTNNITTYNVSIGIKEPSGVKIGMSANVNILVESKKGALTIPVEALMDRDGKKYVMVPLEDKTNTNNNADNQQNEEASENKQENLQQNTEKQKTQENLTEVQNKRNAQRNSSNTMGIQQKLVPVEIGLINENTVEVISGINEGQVVLISMPQTTSTNINMKGSSFNGMMPTGGAMRTGGASGSSRGTK